MTAWMLIPLLWYCKCKLGSIRKYDDTCLLGDKIVCITGLKIRNRAAFKHTRMSGVLYLDDGKLKGAATQGKISIMSALK